MVEAWFAIFWLMVAAYTILDGRNLGAAALRPFVAKEPAERRQVLDAIGPLWTWHEVWLIAAGGVLLLAFPAALAAAFAGFYLALFLVLWLLIGRGIAMEVEGHIDHALWQSFWTFILSTSSAGLALILGVAFGNIVRGVPMDASGEFHMAFFTNFNVRGDVGLIDWYTLSVGAFALVALLAHGATYLVRKTTGPVQARSWKVGRRLWLLTLVTGTVVALETWIVRPDLACAMVWRMDSVVFLIVAACGACAVYRAFRTRQDRWAFVGSSALIAGVVGARAAAAFPVLLHSTLDPARSVSAYQAAVSRHSLAIAFFWWLIAAPIALLWYILASRSFRSAAAFEPPTPPG